MNRPLLALLLLAGCIGEAPVSEPPDPAAALAPLRNVAPGDALVVAAGDIADCGRLGGARATAGPRAPPPPARRRACAGGARRRAARRDGADARRQRLSRRLAARFRALLRADVGRIQDAHAPGAGQSRRTNGR